MLNLPIDIGQASEMISHQHTVLTEQKALLVAISGIDGSGKGYITSKIAELMAQQHLNIATINI
ncbi:MAG: uridine kinase, partial [Cyanobacteria bacterium J06638_22]